jgi:hypothetical protein
MNRTKGIAARRMSNCVFGCAPEGIRTPNLLIRSQMLYPLSYGRRCSTIVHGRWSAEAPGFEPGRGFKTPTALAVRRHRPN